MVKVAALVATLLVGDLPGVIERGTDLQYSN